jgi:Protein of unknown function (DUF2721)
MSAETGVVKLDIDTPALVFPAVSFLLLAYTNRYLAIADLARRLLREYEETRAHHLVAQISVLRRRIGLIRLMQTFVMMALLLGVVCMFTLYADLPALSKTVFGFMLVAVVASILVGLVEVQLSTNALDVQLSSVGRDEQ